MWCLDMDFFFSHITVISRDVVGLTYISVNSVCNIFILKLPNCNRFPLNKE